MLAWVCSLYQYEIHRCAHAYGHSERRSRPGELRNDWETYRRRSSVLGEVEQARAIARSLDLCMRIADGAFNNLSARRVDARPSCPPCGDPEAGASIVDVGEVIVSCVSMVFLDFGAAVPRDVASPSPSLSKVNRRPVFAILLAFGDTTSAGKTRKNCVAGAAQCQSECSVEGLCSCGKQTRQGG